MFDPKIIKINGNRERWGKKFYYSQKTFGFSQQNLIDKLIKRIQMDRRVSVFFFFFLNNQTISMIELIEEQKKRDVKL